MMISRRRSAFSLGMVLLMPLGGCGDSGEAAAPQPPPEVSVITIEPKPRRVVQELPGRIAPTQVAEVRARVSGIVISRMFTQGAEVKAGDPLYQIDPKPLEVELQASEASLAKARAAHEQTVLQARRVQTLLATNAASRAQHENAVTNERLAEADVAARNADVARAKLNLDYATIRAPISGRIGRALVTEGALVGSEATHVATIQKLDTVYADFTQTVGELNRLRREIESGAIERIAPDAIQAELEVDEGTTYALPGKVLFSDTMVDPATGQVVLRAEFQNPRQELLPGMYVRVRITEGIDSDSIAVPQQAVQRNAGGKSEVFVIRNGNRVVSLPVQIGAAFNDEWLVLDGLRPSDRVVVEGFQKFVSGDAVRPSPWRNERQSAALSSSGASP